MVSDDTDGSAAATGGGSLFFGSVIVGSGGGADAAITFATGISAAGFSISFSTFLGMSAFDGASVAIDGVGAGAATGGAGLVAGGAAGGGGGSGFVGAADDDGGALLLLLLLPMVAPVMKDIVLPGGGLGLSAAGVGAFVGMGADEISPPDEGASFHESGLGVGCVGGLGTVEFILLGDIDKVGPPSADLGIADFCGS